MPSSGSSTAPTITLMDLPPHRPAPVAADAVLDHVGPGTNVVVPLANGEPVTVLDALEAAAPGREKVASSLSHS